MSSRNPFGGKNPNGLYVPLSDDELEVLARIADAGEFKLVVKDWGHITGFMRGRYDANWHSNPVPLVVFGDKRLSFYFRLSLTAPVLPQPNWYFDLEVWALGFKLFSQRMPTESGGVPIQVAAGVDLDLALDIAIDQIDPKIVKTIKPKAIGLTTRHGNMRLDLQHQKLLEQMQSGERRVREVSAREALEATKKMKKATSR